MDAFEELFDLVGDLARRRFQAGERGFAKLGLSHTEARLLTLLQQAGGEAAQDILSNSLTVDRSNAVRALQRLAENGFVLRRKDEADRRANLIRITPKGAKVAGKIGMMRKELAQQFFGDLREPEALVVLELLRKAIPEQ
jgi:DNA-binding MarR family transcriptional regulator